MSVGGGPDASQSQRHGNGLEAGGSAAVAAAAPAAAAPADATSTTSAPDAAPSSTTTVLYQLQCDSCGKPFGVGRPTQYTAALAALQAASGDGGAGGDLAEGRFYNASAKMQCPHCTQQCDQFHAVGGEQVVPRITENTGRGASSAPSSTMNSPHGGRGGRNAGGDVDDGMAGASAGRGIGSRGASFRLSVCLCVVDVVVVVCVVVVLVVVVDVAPFIARTPCRSAWLAHRRKPTVTLGKIPARCTSA